jgi:uncharacterized membrane protein YoaK (UPF0700 family)
MLFQIFMTAGVLIYKVLQQPPPTQDGLAAQVAWTILFFSPTITGFVLGCYSVKVAGRHGRNKLGELGLALAIIVVVLLSCFALEAIFKWRFR